MKRSATELWDELLRLQKQLGVDGYSEMVSRLEDAKAAGATSLEIHFRVMGVLRQMTSELYILNAPIARRTEALTAQFANVLSQ